MNLPLGLWHGMAQLAAPWLRRMLRRRLKRGKEIADRLPEREGRHRTPRPPGRLIWLHAASLGETMSVLPLLPHLLAEEGHVLLTTGTVTAQQLLAQRLPALGLAERVIPSFVPLDVPAWAARFLDHWRPDAAGFVESEIWPNLLAAAAARRIPLMLINARLSARSLARWRRAPRTAGAVFGFFTLIHPRSAADAARFAILTKSRILPPGNLKLAASPLPVDRVELSSLTSVIAGPAWVAASLHPGEDALILAVHARLSATHPGLTTILVPRHPDRGAALAAAAQGAPRRAMGAPPPERGGIWIADTVGELGLIYRLAPLAFIGGSLVPHGGQNPAEAARLGCAVAVGPHTENFADTIALLTEGGGLAVVADAQGLGDWLDARLKDPWGTAAMGARGAALLSGYESLPGEVASMLAALADPARAG